MKQTKKIAIDISPILYGTGVSVYTKELVRNILEIDKHNQYIIFGYSLRRKSDLEEFYNEIKTKNTLGKFFNIPPMVAHIVWNKMHILDIQRIIGDVDVIHTSDWTEPPAENVYKVTTVHDLTPLIYPEYTHPRIRTVHQLKLKRVKDETNVIIAPSKQTEKDLKDLGFKNRVVTIPEAVGNDIELLSEKQSKDQLKKYDLPEKFALMVGTAPRKNVLRTSKALQKVSQKTEVSKLVIVGERPETKNFTKDVIFLGKVSSRDLSALYRLAEVFLYTSIYEGFGIPVLEAFKCKCPVVASDVGSVAEISKGSAVMVNPENIDSISKGIVKALSKRKDLISKGLAREKKFSWRETARQTIKLYNNNE